MKKRAISIVLAASLLLMAGVVLAAPIMPHIDWWVMGGGRGAASAGDHGLQGTVGQAVVGVSSSGTSELCAGFWCGIEAEYATYLPHVLGP